MPKRTRRLADVDSGAEPAGKRTKTEPTNHTTTARDGVNCLEQAERSALVDQDEVWEEVKDERIAKKRKSKSAWWKERKDVVVDEGLETRISSAWNTSGSVGGSLLNIDPLFSADEE